MLLLIVGFLVGATPQAALADSPANASWKYRTTAEICVKGKARSEHGPFMTGYHKATTESWGWSWAGGVEEDMPCSAPWNRDAGKIAVYLIVQEWTGSTWANCWSSGWKYNSTTTYGLWSSLTNGYWGPPCGDGWYRTRAISAVKYNNVWNPDPSGNTYNDSQWFEYVG